MPRNSARTIRETDLYAPVRDYLVAQGYVVRGEVHGCDVAAVKDDDLILIELKRAPNLSLLIQAAQRQRMSDSVYVAIPTPAIARGRDWRGFVHLLRRLELGLIVVTLGVKPSVQIVHHPQPFDRKKGASKRKRRAIITEAVARSGDHNVGGGTRTKLVTAYRENAIQIAAYLEILGPSAPKALRAHDSGPKTQSILYDNVYGWFVRAGVGFYELSPAGRAALKEYDALARYYQAKLPAP